MGGRGEVWYGVVCRICPSADFTNPASCSWCGEDVPMMHQLSRAPDSITLSWPQPDRPNGDILEYQLRYYDKGSDEDSAASVFSETNTATIMALIPGSIYAFQIRARNERGYGPRALPTDTEPAAAIGRFGDGRGSLPIGGGHNCGRRGVPQVELSSYVDAHQRYEDPSEAVKEVCREIDPTHLKIEEVIGAAQLGEVSRGRYRPMGRKGAAVAVKTLRWGVTEREKGMFSERGGRAGPPERIVTEFMENGPLDAFLRENEDQFSVLQLVGMVRGVGAGMRYLSERNFVHRDLAARNVLVNSNLVCKVSDFGLSRLMRGLDHNMPTYTASLHRKFSSASDIWSFGVLMVMSYGERPYWDMSNQEVMKAVAEQYRLPAPVHCPPALHSLMLQCWQADRAERPAFDTLLSSLDRLIRHPASLKSEHTRTVRAVRQ
ncbi:LOW QUALITY PROTEIN: hypothetical protein CRUP_037817 [Coryphaenoides rupestris]|nr:LOW QUALITY PROTEIN: hypothetical protein CRUP_037817 [Coryphaenoides rupestris]